MLGLLAGGYINTTAQTPKIVVGIVVDQLRTDYLEQLRPYFGQNGLSDRPVPSVCGHRRNSPRP